jgi:lysophospholipase L1-like esterase
VVTDATAASLAATSADDYAKMLGQTIAQSRLDAGWTVPWGVALASFHPSAQATEERQLAVINGQKKVIAQTSDVFLGPATDSFRKRGFLGDGVHFNAEGLAAHARGWSEAIAPLLEKHSAPPRKEGQE